MAKEDAGSAQALRISVNNQKFRIILENEIISCNKDWERASIEWYSPLAPSYKEFKSSNFWSGVLPGSNKDSFWNKLENASNRLSYKSFWPVGGPHWDAIGVLEDIKGKRTLLLIEAKAQKHEHKGTKSRAKAQSSIDTINNSLDTTQKALFSSKPNEWHKDNPYFQLENRLAYLEYLSGTCKIPTCLVYVYFINDSHALKINQGVSTREEWESIICDVMKSVGLDNDQSQQALRGRMIEVFIQAPPY